MSLLLTYTVNDIGFKLQYNTSKMHHNEPILITNFTSTLQ